MAPASEHTTSTYPPGTKFWETSDWAGGRQADLNIALIVISGFFVGTRLYVRFMITKTPGWDDAITVLAFLVITSLSAFNIHLKDYGAGAHIELIPENLLLEFFLVSQIKASCWIYVLLTMSTAKRK